MNHNEEKNLNIVLSYYKAMVKSNFNAMSEYLSDDVCLLSPLDEIKGKESVLAAAKNFGEMLEDIEIKSQFSDNKQVMLMYKMIALEPIGSFKAAVLITLQDSKITKIELFYDARPFVKIKDDIFGSK